MAKYTRQDILDLIEEEDVKFIRLQFTDIAGNLKNTATTVDQIDKILSGKPEERRELFDEVLAMKNCFWFRIWIRL